MVPIVHARRIGHTKRPIRDEHIDSRPTMGWRWFALLSSSAMVLHTWAAARAGAPNLATFLESHGNAFAPTTPAFALVGAIHVALIAFGVVQLTKRHVETRVFDTLAPLVGLSSLVASFQLIGAGLDQPWLVAPLGLVLVSTTLVLYLRAHRAIAAGTAPRWVAAPFALWFGWSAALLPAEIAATGWGAYDTLFGSIPAGDVIGLAILGWLAAFALVTAYRFRDAALPATAAWMLLALSVAEPPSVHSIAVVGGIACALAAVIEGSVRVFIPRAKPAPLRPIRARLRTTRGYGVYQLTPRV